MGTAGAPWVVEAIAAASPTGLTGNSGAAVGSTAQIVQAMASFGAPGAANAPPTVAEGADPSQQTLLATPHSAGWWSSRTVTVRDVPIASQRAEAKISVADPPV
jgi:hypothetical protein